MAEFNKADIIAQFEPLRAKAHKTSSITLGIGIPLAVIGLIMFFFCANAGEELVAGFAIGAIMVVVSIPLIVIGASTISKFNKKFITAMKKTIRDAFFPERQENALVGMSQREILFPGFFQTPDRFYSSDYMASSWNGIPFKSSNYKLERREVRHDSNGTHVEYVTYAQGTMYFLDFQRDFGQTLMVLEKGGSSYRYGLKKIETEYIEFNKKFRILGDDETKAFYILTPQLQEKILALEKVFKGQFYMCYTGSDLWIAVNDSGASEKIKISQPLDESVLDDIAKVVATPKLFIDNLELTKQKYKDDSGVK